MMSWRKGTKKFGAIRNILKINIFHANIICLSLSHPLSLTHTQTHKHTHLQTFIYMNAIVFYCCLYFVLLKYIGVQGEQRNLAP
jgi:hypothetical protein